MKIKKINPVNVKNIEPIGRSTGFMEVVVQLIRQNPGKSAKVYAETALENDPNLSFAKNKVSSLANTLSKQVHEDCEKRVIRRKDVKGKYLYFPEEQQPEDILSIYLSPSIRKKLNNFIELGLFDNKEEAAKWLLQEGIKSTLKKIKK